MSKEQERDEIRWEFPEREASEKEKVNLMAACLEIGVRTCFENHVYQFGGRLFLQAKGGPIGMRVTMAAARVVMGEWGRKMTEILMRSNIKIWMKALYVDDMRKAISSLEKGRRWVEKSQSFEFKDDWKNEDDIKGESSTRRTANEMKKAMESINGDLKFEMELEEDFEDNKLPTLDFSMRLARSQDGPGQIWYDFYEKPMNTKYCIMEKSAMAERSKISSLSQDLIRRLQNTHTEIGQERKNEIVENYINKLRSSGYLKVQVREIIQSGLLGFQSKVKRCQEQGQSLHRSAGSTLTSRYKKKIMAKTNWYKNKAKRRSSCKEEKGRSKTKSKGKKSTTTQVKAVLFVPRTKGGELAKRLRTEEENLEGITGYRLKIVERSGKQVRREFCKSNPWAGTPCQRTGCLVCEQEGGEGGCRKRGILYKTTCLQCKGTDKEASYIGESARSGYERGLDHQRDYESMELDSHMMKHQILSHGELQEKLTFQMKILRVHTSAFMRQVHEAVAIEMNEKNNILNSKGGFNRCKLPRLSITRTHNVP